MCSEKKYPEMIKMEVPRDSELNKTMDNKISKKILLINPPSPSFVTHKDKSIPLSLLYLSAILKKNNYNVKIIDMNNEIINSEDGDFENYFSGRFINEFNSFNPDMIGVTCLFSGRFKSAMNVINKIKKISPSVPIVLGGIHPTIFPREILKDYNVVEYICLGEGEISFPKLIHAHFNNQNLLKDINGIAYRQEGGLKLIKKRLS